MVDFSSAAALHPADLGRLFVARGARRDRDDSSYQSYQRTKRVLGVVVCVLSLPIVLVALVACAIAIRLDSPGAVLETQECAGLSGRRFRRLRLRTRPGRVGSIVRAAGLADLPQIFNVLRGEMSLVGPRPTPVLRQEPLWYTARLEVRPGLVSAAMVAGRASLGRDERVRIDIGYIRSATLGGDAEILLRAVGIAVRRWCDLVLHGLAVPAPLAPAMPLAGTHSSRRSSVDSVPRAAAAAEPVRGYWTVRNALLVCADTATILGAIVLSYYIRFARHLALPGATAGVEASGHLLLQYVKAACILAAVWQYLLWREGAYHRGLRGSSAPTVRMAVIASGGAYALAIVLAIGALYRDLLLSRQVYAMGAVLAAAALAGVRAAFELLDRRRAARGDAAGRVLVVGVNESSRAFVDALRRDAPWMQVVGFLAEDESDGTRGDAVVGHVRDVAALHRRIGFDTLVLASPMLAAEAMSGGRDERVSLVNFCEERGISLYMLPGTFSVAVSPEEVASFSGMPLIRLEDASLHPAYALVKRVADALGALAILVLGLPLWLLIAALVKLTSPGPLFFTQLRAGRHGRPFRMYKFRSMSADAETRLTELVDLAHLDEPVFKLKNDPRVTRIGGWLRRTGLDEIPQLLNVLRGEMSIVGPRPEEVRLVDQYTPCQRRRLKARPGITGYQQIRNRGGTSLAERVEYDLVYLKHQGPMLDLYILCSTPGVLVRGSGITH